MVVSMAAVVGVHLHGCKVGQVGRGGWSKPLLLPAQSRLQSGMLKQGCAHTVTELAVSGHEQPRCIFAQSIRQSAGAFAQLAQQISQPMQSSILSQPPLQLAWLRKSTVKTTATAVLEHSISSQQLDSLCLPLPDFHPFLQSPAPPFFSETVGNEGLNVPGKGCVRDWRVGHIFSKPPSVMFFLTSLF